MPRPAGSLTLSGAGAFLLLLTLLAVSPDGARAAPGLGPVDKRVALDEAADAQVITDLCRLPGVDVELRTRSNMLTSEEVDALRHCRHPRVELRPPFLPAHLERLDRLPRLEPLLMLAAAATPVWLDLAKFGPRRWQVRLGGELTQARAQALAPLRNASIELDLRGRVPGAEELARLRALDHVGHTVRIGADAPPELVAALEVVRPAEVVVETHANSLPAPLLAALSSSDLPIRVSLTWPVSPHDLEPLAAVPRLALEVDLGSPQRIPRGFLSVFAPVDPDLSLPQIPDGGHPLLLPPIP